MWLLRLTRLLVLTRSSGTAKRADGDWIAYIPTDADAYLTVTGAIYGLSTARFAMDDGYLFTTGDTQLFGTAG